VNQNFKIKKSALNRCISVYHRVGAKKTKMQKDCAKVQKNLLTSNKKQQLLWLLP